MVLTQRIHKLQAPFLRMTSYGDSKDFYGGLLQEKIFFQSNTTWTNYKWAYVGEEKEKCYQYNCCLFHLDSGWFASYKFLIHISWNYLFMINDTMFSRDRNLTYVSLTCSLSCMNIFIVSNMFLVTYHGGILWILCWPIIDHKGWSFLQILALVLLAGSKA